MAILTCSKAALRCPDCGKVSYHDLSLFDFSGTNSVRLECDCGTVVISLGTKDKKHYWLQVECSLCGDKHLYYHHWKELWDESDRVLPLVCDEASLDVAYIGPEGEVEEAMENSDGSLAEMAESLGFGDYFVNSSVMYGVLESLNQLAENGHLFCECGNFNVEIEIYPDKLELRCDYCSYSGIIMARDEKDMEIIHHMSEIQLTKKGFRCLDGNKI